MNATLFDKAKAENYENYLIGMETIFRYTDYFSRVNQTSLEDYDLEKAHEKLNEATKNNKDDQIYIYVAFGFQNGENIMGSFDSDITPYLDEMGEPVKTDYAVKVNGVNHRTFLNDSIVRMGQLGLVLKTQRCRRDPETGLWIELLDFSVYETPAITKHLFTRELLTPEGAEKVRLREEKRRAEEAQRLEERRTEAERIKLARREKIREIMTKAQKPETFPVSMVTEIGFPGKQIEKKLKIKTLAEFIELWNYNADDVFNKIYGYKNRENDAYINKFWDIYEKVTSWGIKLDKPKLLMTPEELEKVEEEEYKAFFEAVGNSSMSNATPLQNTELPKSLYSSIEDERIQGLTSREQIAVLVASLSDDEVDSMLRAIKGELELTRVESINTYYMSR